MRPRQPWEGVRGFKADLRGAIGHSCWAKKSRDLATVFGFILFSLAPSTNAEDGRAGLPRYVQTDKQDAECSLTLTCSLEGVFSSHKNTFYLRARQGIADMGILWTSGGDADGQGVGHNYRASIKPLNTAVEVEVSVYWTSKNAQGTSRVLFLVPYFQEKEGRDAGFSYSLTWEKLK